MRIAYLILNYKSYQDTINVSDKILAFMHQDDMIVIVDNQSPNESFDVLSKRYKSNSYVHILQTNENGGYAKGNNFGLTFMQRYNPQYVCVINNDVFFEKDCIDAMISAYQMIPDAGAISPVQHDINNRVANLQKLKCYNFWDDLFSYFKVRPSFHSYACNTKFVNIQKVGFVPGSFIFIDYSLFERIGFFYEGTFLFMEETFLAKRLQEINKSCYIVLDTSYIHAHSKTINSEASRVRQKQYLLDSRIQYTLEYRTCPKLKVFLLKNAFRLNLILGKIKKMIKHNR